MFDEGTKLPQDFERGSPSGVGLLGTAGSGSGFISAKPATEIISKMKPANPTINSSQEVCESHDVDSSNSEATPVVVHHADKNNSCKGKGDLAGEGGGGDAIIGDSGVVTRSKSKSMKRLSDSGVKDATTPTICGTSKGKGVSAGAERRKKTKNVYSTLHSALPWLPHKADNVTILAEAVDYIKTLQGAIRRLELELSHPGLGVAHLPSIRHGTSMPATRDMIMADMVQSLNTQQTAVCMPGSSVMPRATVKVPPSIGPSQTWSGLNIAVSVTGDDGFINMCIPRQHDVVTKVCTVLEKHRIDLVTADISSDQSQSTLFIHARIDAASTHFLENLTAEDRYNMAVAEMLQSFAN